MMSLFTRRAERPRALAITRAVLAEIERTIGSRPAELGGMLGGRREDGVVRHFYFDHSARSSGVTYTPDHELLNRLLARDWNPAGIFLLGFVHSHHACFPQPSGGDAVYARRILEHLPDLERLLLPIVMTEPEAERFELLGFAATRTPQGVHIDGLELSVVDEAPIVLAPLPVDREPAGLLAPAPERPRRPDLAATFQRVRGAYDLERLAASRVLYVGLGGAAAFAEELARAGVGAHVLIDPDTVSESNLATQQAYRRDLGRPKVECVAERLRDIHPGAYVNAVQRSLDEIDDAGFERLATQPLRNGLPGVTLLCGLTDSFEAQARVNRLALHFGLPSLCAQVYHEGRGAEITFTLPGVTPACQRCALSSRYRAYLEQGFQNDVGSDGTPIFATTRLNALKGFLALALLHHRSPHPRWGRLLERIGNRNLVQIRMDPDLALPVFGRVFGGGDSERILFDEPVWLPQKPDCPENGYPLCPDCGGTGDLRDATGSFDDTRPMRPQEAAA
jgi:hypothetical protein